MGDDLSLFEEPMLQPGQKRRGNGNTALSYQHFDCILSIPVGRRLVVIYGHDVKQAVSGFNASYGKRSMPMHICIGFHPREDRRLVVKNPEGAVLKQASKQASKQGKTSFPEPGQTTDATWSTETVATPTLPKSARLTLPISSISPHG